MVALRPRPPEVLVPMQLMAVVALRPEPVVLTPWQFDAQFATSPTPELLVPMLLLT